MTIIKAVVFDFIDFIAKYKFLNKPKQDDNFNKVNEII